MASIAGDPFRGVDFVVIMNGVTMEVVTSVDMRLTKEGGTVEHVYGSEEGRISTGGNRGTFTVQRWFAVDDTTTDLLYDIFNAKTKFLMTGTVNSQIIGLSGCRANSWRPILGDANAIIGEELSGEATSWSNSVIS
jgi:hypothetical protein